MKTALYSISIFVAAVIALNCGGCASSGQRVEVAFHDVPYTTEKNLRIGYTLKTWEFEKENLELKKIIALDGVTGEELLVIDSDSIKAGVPKVYKDPLPPTDLVVWDKLTSYYISIQLPIPLGKTPPKTVTNRLVLSDKSTQKEVVVTGGTFAPRLGEKPMVIASPLKGKNLIFINQSTMEYHFYVLFFLKGGIPSPERYAADTMQFNDALTATLDGDPAKNESYFNYKSPLYAVADGTVVSAENGKPERNGNTHDVKMNTLMDYLGNYIILDIGGGRFAYYCHAVTGSVKVKAGDKVKEGDELAKLGNSGNSDAPHLHFHVCDGPDFASCKGLPFVLKNYTATGEVSPTGQPPVFLTPTSYTNAMMEQPTIFKVE
ncbi:MAG: M23 family metallopeptidase [Myxococcota bacterium]|jgi:hypothetical protein